LIIYNCHAKMNISISLIKKYLLISEVSPTINPFPCFFHSTSIKNGLTLICKLDSLNRPRCFMGIANNSKWPARLKMNKYEFGLIVGVESIQDKAGGIRIEGHQQYTLELINKKPFGNALTAIVPNNNLTPTASIANNHTQIIIRHPYL
jgi:hypothetical protein